MPFYHLVCIREKLSPTSDRLTETLALALLRDTHASKMSIKLYRGPALQNFSIGDYYLVVCRSASGSEMK